MWRRGTRCRRCSSTRSAQLPPAEVEALAATCNAGPVIRQRRAHERRRARRRAAPARGARPTERCRRGPSPCAAAALTGRSLWSLNEWQDGSFEVQDEGSQFVALAPRRRPASASSTCAPATAAIGGARRHGGRCWPRFAYDVEEKASSSCAPPPRARASMSARRRSAPPLRSRRTHRTMSSLSTRPAGAGTPGATRACDGRGRRHVRASMRPAAGAHRGRRFSDAAALALRAGAAARAARRRRVVYATCRSSASRMTTSPTRSRRRGDAAVESVTPPAALSSGGPPRIGRTGMGATGFVARWRRART